MTKNRIGFWLLLSLIPLGIIWIIALAISSSSQSASTGQALAVVLTTIGFPLALVVGITLKILGRAEQNKQYREAQQYAELNGWQPISRTAWRNLKSNGALLSVNQAFEKSTHILTIKVEGDTLTVPGFDSSVLALRFGDWIWSKQTELGSELTRETVQQQRTEWEQEMALATLGDRGTNRFA